MNDVKWTAQIELLSPLHIGTGTTLLDGVDWIQDGPWVHVADQDRLLETVLDRALAEGVDQADVIKAITGMTLADLRDAGRLTRPGPGSPLRPGPAPVYGIQPLAANS